MEHKPLVLPLIHPDNGPETVDTCESNVCMGHYDGLVVGISDIPSSREKRWYPGVKSLIFKGWKVAGDEHWYYPSANRVIEVCSDCYFRYLFLVLKNLC